MISYILIILSIYFGGILAETPATPTPSPQTLLYNKILSMAVSPDCAKLNPPVLQVLPFPVGESVWFIGKIFQNPNAPPLTPGPTTSVTVTPTPVTPPPPAVPPIAADNRCNVLKYGADCTSMKVLALKNEDDTLSLKKAGLNTKTNTVALYKIDVITSDQNKSVMKTQFGFYGFLDQAGVFTYGESTPKDLKDEEVAELVLFAFGENKDWIMFCTCNKSLAFILYTEKIVSEKKTKDFDAKINEAMTALQLDPTALKDVPFDFSIPVDKFIPSLLPPAGP